MHTIPYPQVAQLFSLLAFWRVTTLCSSLMIWTQTVSTQLIILCHEGVTDMLLTFSAASWNLLSSVRR